MQIIGGGGERIRDAVDQVAVAVAVEIDAVFDVVRRRELHPAEFAGPVASHLINGLVAALDDLERVEQLLAEFVAAPAVISQGRQRRQDLELAEQRTVIALEAPHRGDDLARHAIGLLDAAEQRAVLVELGDAVGDAFAAEQTVGELQEGELEYALAGVALDHQLLEIHVG